MSWLRRVLFVACEGFPHHGVLWVACGVRRAGGSEWFRVVPGVAVCERILTQRCAETSDLLVSGVVMPVVRVNPHKVGCGLCRMD